MENPGLDARVVADYKAQCENSPYGFVPHPGEERTPEYAHVYFTGPYEGLEVVYDAVFYTLRLHHESEVYNLVEEMAIKKFPEYAERLQDQDDDTEPPEEVSMFMAEAIVDLEEEEAVRVKEHVEVDADADFGIGLDAGLHVEEITDETMAAFIRDFKAGNLKLDPILYSFASGESDEE